ncbi:hypothetical protein ILUMI_24426 [Ignelater luminosus]|uniref:Uncharacterized protein n=1 Tax=Ignelater luminosus TaxID=2038154 RepID=A0A8K0G0Z6_IGNLU|nr:hypothetical protein ILUMI_24426 [Ignelater luminosus]
MYVFDKILVIAFVLQTITFITSTSVENDLHHLTSNNQTNTTIKNGTTVNSNNHDVLPKDQAILTEGGGKVNPAGTVPKSHNRENAVNETIVNSTRNILPISTSTQKTDLHVNSSTVAPLSIPDLEKSFISSNKTSDHKKISARKGVNFTDIELKKPIITTASEEEPYAPSHFQSSPKINSSAAQSIPKVPNLEMLSGSSQNTQKYVVPIVIVILSVPFVAILISILYKRGAEWWKYRHYRRMDFLINGMYDN